MDERKTALVTGGTSGIGLEMARLFYQKSYNVVIASSNQDNLERSKKASDTSKKRGVHG